MLLTRPIISHHEMTIGLQTIVSTATKQTLLLQCSEIEEDKATESISYSIVMTNTILIAVGVVTPITVQMTLERSNGFPGDAVSIPIVLL